MQEFVLSWKYWQEVSCFSSRNVFSISKLLYNITCQCKKNSCSICKKSVGNKQYGGVRQYIPLKLNAAGVMPIIFAQAIMFVQLHL